MAPVVVVSNNVSTTPTLQEDRMIVQSAAPALYASKAGPPLEDQRPAMYGSYSGVSFSSSFDPDNVAPDRQPLYSG